ncbi:MAG: PfkB family carbohydrate kinase, partial [Actinomycetota bacterium]|nr:PfkB family carbohydrate kinase [Actinomycetota bacterium]
MDLAVVGSINLDISIPVDHLPLPGETVLGGDALWAPGGKGANQAVGASRLGRSVAMIGCVGDDPAGGQLLAALGADGVLLDGVSRMIEVPTGLAAIAVSAVGENSIVVSPGANARLGAAHVIEWIERLAPRAALTQFEVPPEAVSAIVGRVELFVVNP